MAVSKFKNGDKIMISTESNYFGGKAVEIVMVDNSQIPYKVKVLDDSDDYTYWVKESDVDYLIEHEDCVTKKFEKGDIITGKSSNIKKGSINKFKETIMTNIVDFAKNMTLSKEEKTLREAGLKDECGDYTVEAKKIVMTKLIKDNEEYLLEVVNNRMKEEKAK